MSEEDLTLLSVDQVGVAGELAKEYFEVEATLLSRLIRRTFKEIFTVFDHIFCRDRGNVDTWPSFSQFFMKEVEIIVAALYLERSFFIHTFNVITHSSIDSMRVCHFKVFLCWARFSR